MGNEDRATRAIIITVCLLAIAPLMMATLVQIAVHELRCLFASSRTRLKLFIRTLRAEEAAPLLTHGPYAEWPNGGIPSISDVKKLPVIDLLG
jgi:hypothetical protein